VAADTARLFVALELGSDVRAALADWSAEQQHRIEPLRRIRPESLHATLCFLGSQPVSAVAGIAAACREAAAVPAPRLVTGDALWLPGRRPRLLAIALADETGAVGEAGGTDAIGEAGGRLARVQAVLAGALARGGFYQPDARPFLGHVTVARVASGQRLAPVEVDSPAPLAFDADRVTVYRSLLGTGPARYEALETINLTAG
jgi:RNA 2',3'-cyclic 3'-phosphodiesterase